MCGSAALFGKKNNNSILLTEQAGFALDCMPFVGAGRGHSRRTRRDGNARLRRAQASARGVGWAVSALTRGEGVHLVRCKLKKNGAGLPAPLCITYRLG